MKPRLRLWFYIPCQPTVHCCLWCLSSHCCHVCAVSIAITIVKFYLYPTCISNLTPTSYVYVWWFRLIVGMTKPETAWSNIIGVSNDFQSDANWYIGEWKYLIDYNFWHILWKSCMHALFIHYIYNLISYIHNRCKTGQCIALLLFVISWLLFQNCENWPVFIINSANSNLSSF